MATGLDLVMAERFWRWFNRSFWERASEAFECHFNEEASLTKKIVSKEVLQGFIRAQMALLPQCMSTISGPVMWRKPDGDGCNWTVSKLEGHGCLECLEQLRPMLDSLRQHMNLAEPSHHLMKRSATRLARVSVNATASEASQPWRLVDESISASKIAARQSREILRLVRQSSRVIDAQCERAMSAIAASQAVLAMRSGSANVAPTMSG